MKPFLTNTIKSILFFIVLFLMNRNEAVASHAQGTDITYECLGNNQYRINLSFYRDCAGVAAPNSATVNISSATCGYNFNVNLAKVPGTGIDVTPICPQLTTQCNGGTYPGVQEYLYTGIVTLPAQCVDWVFGFTLCCRNAAITNIMNPSAEQIYVESTLNNLNFPCNNSPSFLNKPVPFVCVGQPYCFNNGANDIDGDSIAYKLVVPKTSATTTVTYNAPFSATQPLSSSPAVTFSNTRGDLCMFPTMLEVTVLAMVVEEWRNGVLIGTVMRDIQMKTLFCNNRNPYVNGINNTGNYSITACAGSPITFTIPTFDADPTQNVSITWNNSIPGATFTSSGGARPTGTFSWTPTAAQISNIPYCFTITVKDDNCPFSGSQIFSFCINVDGFSTSTTVTNSNCGLANGSASIIASPATAQYSYFWPSCNCTTSSITGVAAGTYSVIVTSSLGCSDTSAVVIGDNGGALNVNLVSSNALCHGGNTGSITANATGAQGPYSYAWSNGPTTPTNSGLVAGLYSVVVTSNNGCTATVAAIISQPASPISIGTSQTNVTCNGYSDGSATINAVGGTAPYSYSWNTIPVQNSLTATNLATGMYSVIVTDDNGCTASASITIIEPNPLTANAMIVSNVSCNGLSNGSATVGASGGTAPYNYLWNTTPTQTTQTIGGLSAGNYSVIITDNNGCSVTSNIISITQPQILSITSTSTNVTCNGLSNGQATATAFGGTTNYSYQWFPNGGNSANASNLAPGTYTVIVTDANGCTESTTTSISQPAPIFVTATGSTTICLGQNTVIAASASGGSGTYNYTWTGNGLLNGATHIVSPNTPTTYTVNVTDANGCPGNTATVSINVTSLSASNIHMSPGIRICEGASATVFANVTGNTGPVTMVWNNNLGTGPGPFSVTPSNTTTYIVTASDVCNNTVTGSVTVTVNPLPVVNISPMTGIACEAVPLTFTDNSTTNFGAQYLWSFGDGNVSTQTNPVHTYYNSGIYPVNVIVTSVDGCVDSAGTTVTITVYPASKAKFESEGIDGTTINPKYRFYNLSNNAATYAWDFGDGNKSTIEHPTHEYADKGEYIVSLTTTSKDGCVGYYEMKVAVTPEFVIYIPNAFTPDGDGLNDFFAPKGIEIQDFDMEIYSRWGEMIFHTNDLNTGWDGRANFGNDIAQQDVYVYKINIKDVNKKSHTFTGHVTLIKNEGEL